MLSRNLHLSDCSSIELATKQLLSLNLAVMFNGVALQLYSGEHQITRFKLTTVKERMSLSLSWRILVRMVKISKINH